MYPHFVFIKTSFADRHKTTLDHLHEITQIVEENSSSQDKILTFYIPAVAETNREIPLFFNEGPGSISLLDSEKAHKYHMTSLQDIKYIVKNRKVKMIIFSDSFTFYFGRTEKERQEMLEDIQKNYRLLKEFPNYHFADGTKAKALYIYGLP